MNRRKRMVYDAMTVLLLISLKTPIAQRFVAGVLVEFAGITDRIVRLQYWLTKHTRYFFLDRFDPTCPQYM